MAGRDFPNHFPSKAFLLVARLVSPIKLCAPFSFWFVRALILWGPCPLSNSAAFYVLQQVPQYNSRRFQCHPSHHPSCHYETGAPDPCQAHPPRADRGTGSAGGAVERHDHFLQPPRPSYLHHIGAFTDPIQIAFLARERCCCFLRYFHGSSYKNYRV